MSVSHQRKSCPAICNLLLLASAHRSEQHQPRTLSLGASCAPHTALQHSCCLRLLSTIMMCRHSEQELVRVRAIHKQQQPLHATACDVRGCSHPECRVLQLLPSALQSQREHAEHQDACSVSASRGRAICNLLLPASAHRIEQHQRQHDHAAWPL